MTESSGMAMNPRASSNGADSQGHQIVSNADAEYQSYSAQVSTTIRTLALTAIALIWLFAGTGLGQSRSPSATLHRLESAEPLLLALTLALSVLIADFLQYVWGSLGWSTYRWALEQILVNDSMDPEDLSIRSRLGWTAGRLFHVAWHLEWHLYGQSQAASGKSWPERRANLRSVLLTSRSGQEPAAARTALDAPWSPVLISRVISFLFWAKVILLICSYLLLGKFLLL